MPELPDIVYITKKLENVLPEKIITNVQVKDPIVIRTLINGDFQHDLVDQEFKRITYTGHFLRMQLSNFEIIINFMLTGRFQYIQKKMKPMRNIRFSIYLDNDYALHYSDEKNMGRVYFTTEGTYNQIPGYLTQGMNILSDSFIYEYFEKVIRKKRQQARVFLMDHASLSSIGNAYADEILFNAKIHPKTPCNKLNDDDIKRLFKSIRSVIRWGIDEVEKADQSIEIKVRQHLKVRNRKNEKCPVCKTTIRSAMVLGYESFFCPNCQPASGKQFIPW